MADWRILLQMEDPWKTTTENSLALNAATQLQISPAISLSFDSKR